MYIYIHTHICICIYVCISSNIIHRCTYIHTSIHTRARAHTHTHTHTHTREREREREKGGESMCVCIHTLHTCASSNPFHTWHTLSQHCRLRTLGFLEDTTLNNLNRRFETRARSEVWWCLDVYVCACVCVCVCIQCVYTHTHTHKHTEKGSAEEWVCVKRNLFIWQKRPMCGKRGRLLRLAWPDFCVELCTLALNALQCSSMLRA